MATLPFQVSWNAITAAVGAANLYIAVTDSKDTPISGVAATLDGKSAVTGGDGTCAFTGITAGSYTVRCSKVGYQDYTKVVVLTAGDNELGIKMLATTEETWWNKIVANVQKYWYYYAAGGGAVVVTLALTRKKRTP
jgi:hypothetical protein